MNMLNQSINKSLIIKDQEIDDLKSQIEILEQLKQEGRETVVYHRQSSQFVN